MELSYILLPVLSLGSMGIIFGLGLGYAGIKFKVEQDERVSQIRDVLPGANCGGCGLPGCDAFAEAVVAGTARVSGCPVGGASVAEKVGAVMGIKPGASVRKTAFMKCNGGCSNSSYRYDYNGLQDCTAVMQLAGGGAKNCSYGCLGSGSCVKACRFGAISIVDGIASIDSEKCVACGLCVSACPKALIDVVPYQSEVRIACHSNDNGKVVRSSCTVGCIGCKLCEKACPANAIKVDNLLAKIDYDACTNCQACALKCPTGAILVKGKSLKKNEK